MPLNTPYRLGWSRDSPDPDDIPFVASAQTLASLPSQVSLIDRCPPVYSQGNLGSCTAQAIAAAFEFDLMRQGLTDFMPSRLFIYYFERLLEGTVNDDAGAEIRDGIKVVNKYGAIANCPRDALIARCIATVLTLILVLKALQGFDGARDSVNI